MTQTLYYAQLDDEFFGPFELDTLAGMHLTPDIMVLSSQTNTWMAASEYPELVDSLDFTLYERVTETDTSTRVNLPPAVNHETEFYVHRGGNPYGPYTLDDLVSLSVTSSTEVSVDNMATWWYARDVPGLMDYIASVTRNGREGAQRPEPQLANESTEDYSDVLSEIQEIMNKIKGLKPVERPAFRRVFPSKEAEQEYMISEYTRVFNTLVNLVNTLGTVCENTRLSKKAVNMITNTVNDVARRITTHYLKEFEGPGESKSEFSSSSIAIGKTEYSLLPPLDGVEFSRIDFLRVLGNKNISVTYDDASESRAIDFVNSIIGRLYENNPARLIVTDVIDTFDMTGLDDSFKLLNRDLYKVISLPEDVRKSLSGLLGRASNILRNLLVEKGATLQDYNNTHDNKEANILLVVKDFPRSLSSDNLAMLQRIANVGPKAGIYLVALSNRDDLANITEKELEVFDMPEFLDKSSHFDFSANDNDFVSELEKGNTSSILEGNVEFATLTDTDLRQIVTALNAKCELHDDIVVSIGDYIPEPRQWWKNDSARQIEIPFGVGNDMNVKSLKITQESGQNTAVVIGIPGSGKSVFLHSLICSAAVKYSPDELRMYLIDFSGVEFNSYALGKLPHARVIAPEAEREFGLSILNELVEEGSRRMNLCRDYNVSNIVDLKKVAPSIKVPRLLVIIDEFQKLFEIENDLISREANSKIHIIIQEFRKFGINLILATQKLPSGSFLPRDLIANRVVFKSSPADFAALISTDGNDGLPRLRTGQCIYNSESGAAYDNEKVQGYFVSKTEIDSLLRKLADYEAGQSYEREPLKVFRSAEQPDFKARRMLIAHRGFRKAGCSIPVYLGESISVSDYDVYLELNREGANNMLVIGGETEVAESICYHALLGLSTCHADNDAAMVVISGMRPDNPACANIVATLGALPFDTVFPATPSEIEETLTALKETIESRRESGDMNYNNIYVGIFDFQNCRAFDKDTSGRIEKPSASASLLEYVLRNGPSAGVFTILQVDNLENLSKAGSVLSAFNYRIALQMAEMESNKVVGSPAANKLFVFNRPASKYRAYLRDNNRNLLIKFKPYKLS